MVKDETLPLQPIKNREDMKEAFIKLHISIILAGFTGLFGTTIRRTSSVSKEPDGRLPL